jgi:hypothetical protein
MVYRVPWDLVICDEAHHLKDPKGARHTSVAALPRSTDGRTVCMSATPFTNDLETEVVALLHLLGGGRLESLMQKLKQVQKAKAGKRPAAPADKKGPADNAAADSSGKRERMGAEDGEDGLGKVMKQLQRAYRARSIRVGADIKKAMMANVPLPVFMTHTEAHKGSLPLVVEGCAVMHHQCYRDEYEAILKRAREITVQIRHYMGNPGRFRAQLRSARLMLMVRRNRLLMLSANPFITYKGRSDGVVAAAASTDSSGASTSSSSASAASSAGSAGTDGGNESLLAERCIRWLNAQYPASDIERRCRQHPKSWATYQQILCNHQQGFRITVVVYEFTQSLEMLRAMTDKQGIVSAVFNGSTSKVERQWVHQIMRTAPSPRCGADDNGYGPDAAQWPKLVYAQVACMQEGLNWQGPSRQDCMRARLEWQQQHRGLAVAAAAPGEQWVPEPMHLIFINAFPNPARVHQAISRFYRSGHELGLKVFRFYEEGTLESAMRQMEVQKGVKINQFRNDKEAAETLSRYAGMSEDDYNAETAGAAGLMKMAEDDWHRINGKDANKEEEEAEAGAAGGGTTEQNDWAALEEEMDGLLSDDSNEEGTKTGTSSSEAIDLAGDGPGGGGGGGIRRMQQQAPQQPQQTKRPAPRPATKSKKRHSLFKKRY